MKAREPWLAIASVAGFGLMLIGDRAIDAAGFLIATAPLAYGGACLVARTLRM